MPETTSAAFGPDNNLAIDFEQAYKIRVPRDSRAEFKFHCPAKRENAIEIYTAEYMTLAAERGNYSRNTNDFDISLNNEASDDGDHRSYYITGWHKNSDNAPDPTDSWHQSTIKIEKPSDYTTTVSFEDIPGNNNFGAIFCTVRIYPEG